LKAKWLLLEKKNSWSTGLESSSNIDYAIRGLSGLIFLLFISRNSTAQAFIKTGRFEADQPVRLYFSNFMISVSPISQHGGTLAVNNPTSEKAALQHFQEALRKTGTNLFSRLKIPKPSI
jgi:hypothetical protein